MKKLIILAAVAAIAGGVQATTLSWGASLGGGDGTSWNGANNWFDHVANAISVNPPAAIDTIQISDGLFGNALATFPEISATAESATTVVIGQTSTGYLTVSGTGSLGISGTLYVGTAENGAGDDSTLTLADSGGIVANALVFGNVAGVAGIVNMSGTTVLHIGALVIGNDGLATSSINMSDSAFFLINGDQSGAGYENSLVVATGAGESIAMSYNGTFDRTEYTVIPEPATLGMVALMGGGIMFIRRKFMI